MRLSSLVVAAFLIIPSSVFAQHSSTASPSSTASSSHVGSSSGSSSGASSHVASGAGSSHGSASSSSAVSHSASGHASSGSTASARSHNPNSTPLSSNSPSAGSRANLQPVRSAATPPQSDATQVIHEPESNAQHKENGSSATKTAQPQRRSFFSFLRNPFRRHEPKSTEPDRHRRICKTGPCKEPAPEPVVIAADLRERICTKEPCPHCLAGESRGKNGACEPNSPANTPSRCLANEAWNGAVCVANGDPCAAFRGRAAIAQNDVRGAREKMQAACSTNSSSQECDEFRQQYDAAMQRYRMLLNEAPVKCRELLPDPLSL